MRIGHIELFVHDPMESRQFYEGVLGFEVVTVQGRNLWLKLDATEILLRPGESPRAQSYAAAGAALVLYVEDLDATAAQLRERGVQFAGTDGHWFQLVNPDDH